MKQADERRLEWLGFADFSAALLYEVLRFRQAIFVVEQCCAYPDLDGRDRHAHHLLLWAEGELAGCLRLIPFDDQPRIATFERSRNPNRSAVACSASTWSSSAGDARSR